MLDRSVSPTVESRAGFPNSPANQGKTLARSVPVVCVCKYQIYIAPKRYLGLPIVHCQLLTSKIGQGFRSLRQIILLNALVLTAFRAAQNWQRKRAPL